MPRLSRARPDVPNGKPLGRHVDTWRRRKRAVARSASAGSAAVIAPQAKKYGIAVRAVAVMSVSVGIVGTMALPSYAIHPDELHAGGLRPHAGPTAEVQHFVVPARVSPPVAARDAITATTMEELEAKRAKQRAEEQAIAAAKQQAIEAAAAGLPVGHIAAAPDPAPDPASPATPVEPPDSALSAESGSIVSLARQFLGVPYVFGGASPSGFDCSGLVLYVYAEFGITLPHSSMRQAVNGTRVSEPVPGDLVVVDGGNHIGIYTGNGNMIDAPMPGRVVNERPIYTSNHYFVRY